MRLGRDGRPKSRQSPATFLKKAQPFRNLGDSPRVDQRLVAASEAKRKMPIICTKYEFDLIMLHESRAGPISISVT